MTRVERFRELENHAWYGRYYKKLSRIQKRFCELWIEDRARLDANGFETAVNGMWLGRERPKNWALLQELIATTNVVRRAG